MSSDILNLPPPPTGATLAYGSLAMQVGDLRLPGGPGPFPAVVTIHGGFWRNRYDRVYMGHAAAALTAAGFATWNIEYRRLGDGGGGWPDTFVDVAAAFDFLSTLPPTYPLDRARIIALGHSAGGHLALWLAARHKIAADSPLACADAPPPLGVVSLAGVANLRAAWELALSDRVVEDFLGGTPRSVPDRYHNASPYDLLPLGLPQILIHGTLDESVPYAMSARYVEEARARGDEAVLLIALEGVEHFAPVDPRTAAWPLVLDAVTSLLG